MTSRQSPPIAAILCLLLSGLAGCAAQPIASRVAAEEESRRAAEDVAENRKMQQGFIHLRRIKTALIAAELATARAEAEALRTVGFNQKTPGWATHAESYGQAVAKLEQSGDLDAAAGDATRLAVVCGECHAAKGVDPGLGIPTRPRGTADPWGKKRKDEEVHKSVHQWGVDRMWDALLAPSDEMWAAGVTAFVDPPVEAGDGDAVPKGVKFKGKFAKEPPKAPVKEPPEKPRDPARQAYVDRFVATTAPLADAGGPTNPAERARVLGEILAVCAGCHQLPPPKNDDDAK